jgi:hypothetical protein
MSARRQHIPTPLPPPIRARHPEKPTFGYNSLFTAIHDFVRERRVQPRNDPNTAGVVVERKMDGIFVRIAKDGGGKVTLLSKNLKETRDIRTLSILSGQPIPNDTILHGEYFLVDKDNLNKEVGSDAATARFFDRSSYMNAANSPSYEAYILVFDTPWFDGQDVRKKPLHERKQLLSTIKVKGNIFKLLTPDSKYAHLYNALRDSVDDKKGLERFVRAHAGPAEGFVLKRLDAPYDGHETQRSKHVTKFKPEHSRAYVCVAKILPNRDILLPRREGGWKKVAKLNDDSTFNQHLTEQIYEVLKTRIPVYVTLLFDIRFEGTMMRFARPVENLGLVFKSRGQENAFARLLPSYEEVLEVCKDHRVRVSAYLGNLVLTPPYLPKETYTRLQRTPTLQTDVVLVRALLLARWILESRELKNRARRLIESFI